MTKTLRVGVIGAGIAARHLSGFGWNPELFEVAVLCSLDEDRGRALCEEHKIAEYTQDVDTLFARDDLDIIDICTPPDSHFELCKRGIEAGKHVICEKPLYGSIAEVDAMIKIVGRTDRLLMPIFQYRYGTGLQKLKYLIERGLAGRPFLTTIETHWWRGPDYYAVPWRGKWKSELGGGLLGHAIHAHDMLNYVHGACAEVFSHGTTLVNPIEVEDTATLSVKMENGSLAALSMTLGSRKEISRLRFCFSDLVAESVLEPYTMGRDPWTFVAGTGEHQARVDVALAEYKNEEDGYTRQFQLFHKALIDGTEPPVTLQDARRSLELVTAAYYSHRTSEPAAMPICADHPLYHSWLPEAAPGLR
ncbi:MULTISPECIES: Gfo/Idh/MocA family protein [Rhizobium]|uniref:Gfo/Idh/MocA family oxidoreductase n=1 Tax=Rhizobium lentis TaxID=1138194 RepID=A0ABS7I8W6_9HYPH|nr:MULTISPECIES: Gfo/Idh/MocA family oxidoreductase [Rhizobium]MBX4922275.1 Gfo/Idh/MocA family oxidoreductase [Rhizobium bangladeshense]MBX5088282.1 Gfo/Idh/MocA family oxidoreductase [Rhizobium lentis]MBX5101218.1 Gfo/Idh/MocA family oxidoreductase [Rhizobium lentis]MBY3599232.1 Gfo/Idh/MocA family oxidoreductase [Rhizobium bangladeshense]